MYLRVDDEDLRELRRQLASAELHARTLRDSAEYVACSSDAMLGPRTRQLLLRRLQEDAGRLAVAAGQSQALAIKVAVRLEVADDDTQAGGLREPDRG